MFNASWFGGFDTAAPLHVVRDGRFAYLPVPADPQFAESNSFGRLTDVYNQVCAGLSLSYDYYY